MTLRALGCTIAATFLAVTACAVEPAETGPFSAFFPFCIDTHDSAKRSLEEQAVMLEELGYSGMGHLWLDNLKERCETLDAHGLKLYQITLRVSLDPDQEAYDPRLEEALPLLDGRGVQLLAIMTGMAPSDPAGDERGVEIIREMADMAAPYGAEVLIYPHTGDWMQRFEDAVRVAKEVDRPNVGVMFNLCHWLKVDGKSDLRTQLEEGLHYLRAVSIHGADTAEEIHAGTGNWIQPLGLGSYDVGALLTLLHEIKYKGPIGLQCWGIPGDAKTHLAQSMKGWMEMIKHIPE